MLDARQEGVSYRRVEVITGQRWWRSDEKARIVARALRGCEHLRGGARFDAAGFEAFFPEDDPEMVEAAWKQYDVIRSIRDSNALRSAPDPRRTPSPLRPGFEFSVHRLDSLIIAASLLGERDGTRGAIEQPDADAAAQAAQPRVSRRIG